jgi:hypothetical protein
MKRRGGMKTRSRRGRLSVRKTRSRSQRKSQRKQQRGGNFIQRTLGVPEGAYVTIDLDPEDGSAPVLIKKEEGADQEVA